MQSAATSAPPRAPTPPPPPRRTAPAPRPPRRAQRPGAVRQAVPRAAAREASRGAPRAALVGVRGRKDAGSGAVGGVRDAEGAPDAPREEDDFRPPGVGEAKGPLPPRRAR